MKAYKKAEIIAKNLPSGSYAAGCPAQDAHRGYSSCIIDFGTAHQKCCKECERAY